MPQENFLDRFCYSIYQYSKDHRLVEEGDSIIISLSGGIDSIGLLHVLSSFRIKLDLQLHIVHFNHGLRPESREEAEFIEALGKQKEIPVTIYETDRLSGAKGMQAKARDWRYRLLDETLEKLNFNKIALGHHLDDLVETQIWKMTRGGSLFSLNPIQPESPPYIRPLLNTRKKEIRQYLIRSNLEWREDSSNQEDEYTRNLIRNRIVPLLERCAGGDLSRKLQGLNDDASLLKEVFDKEVPRDIYETDTLSFNTITGLNPLFANELIHRFLLFNNQTEVNRDNILRILELVKSGRGNWSIDLKHGSVLLGKNKEISCLSEKDPR